MQNSRPNISNVGLTPLYFGRHKSPYRITYYSKKTVKRRCIIASYEKNRTRERHFTDL